MPRNGSGTFVPSPSSVYPAVANTVIDPVAFNTLQTDIATGLTQSISKDGQTVITADLPMGGFKHTGVASGSARTDYSSIAQIQDGGVVYAGTVAGTGDAITATLTPAISALVTGMKVSLIAGSPNTGATTLNLNSIGNTAVKKRGTTALGANDILAGMMVEFEYDGTNWQLLNPATAATLASNSVTTAMIQDDAVTYAKMQNVSATSRFLGRITSGAGDTEELTPTQATSLLNNLVGDSGSGGTKGLVPAPASGDAAAGKFLKADATWATISTPGMTFLGVQTASASAALSFTSLISSTYDKYLFTIDDLDVGSSATSLLIEVSTDNGSNWKTTGYVNNLVSLYSGGASYEVGTTAVFLNFVTGAIKNTTPVSGQIYFSNPNSTANLCLFNGQVTAYVSNNSLVASNLVMGYYGTTGAAINAIRLRLSSGNIVSGSARLYGLKKS